MRKTIFLFAAACFAALALSSCQKAGEGEYYEIPYPNAIVTVKPSDNAAGCYLQLDATTTLNPVNLNNPPYKNKEVRALVNFSKVRDGSDTDFTYDVKVNWMDSILTKNAIPRADVGGKDFGNDPVEIVNDWVTIAEDGYLTLRFRTMWGATGIKHRVNLVSDKDGDGNFILTFHHDANGDVMTRQGDGLVAFRLDNLPDIGEDETEMTLKWKSFLGEKSIKFRYFPRAAVTKASEALTERFEGIEIQ